MFVIRPITDDDFDQMMALASDAGYGFTSLLPKKSYIMDRIKRSISEQAPLFVLEELSSKRVIGTTGVKKSAGKAKSPFYSFRIETAHRHSKTLGIKNAVRTLHLNHQFKGPTEVGTLMLLPEYRHAQQGLGRLLSLCRFLHVAEFPHQYNNNILAEMRGLSDGNGESVFWEAIGRHFFKLDFDDADRQSAIDKRFIADLMPIYPIYIPLLPKEARDVIGRVHPDAKPAQKILVSEGFRFNNLVDIFDGGATMQAHRDEIRTVRESKHYHIKEIAEIEEAELIGRKLDDPHKPRKDMMLIMAKYKPHFRCALGYGQIVKGKRGIRISPQTAEALQVQIDDTIRVAPLYPSPSNSSLDIEPDKIF
ncbi:arginine N-succinyltransferase [Planctomycetota bacterium]|nr:arginine N-succinyltransferase [Planctomycetota bacterium]